MKLEISQFLMITDFDTFEGGISLQNQWTISFKNHYGQILDICTFGYFGYILDIQVPDTLE